MTEILPGPRQGAVVAPPSKSHAHRLLIANFLAGDRSLFAAAPGDSDDIIATRRCLAALAQDTCEPVLDCGESGSTLRFLAPIAAALGKRPRFVRRGRLAERPFREYASLGPGCHELPGDVSSQFVTGLLFALPLLAGSSSIRFTTPLESRGYVDMTLRVLTDAGIVVDEVSDGFDIPGNQSYRPQQTPVEGDWSGAAFWYGMNALGCDIAVSGLLDNSAQPDHAIVGLVSDWPAVIDVSQFPDIFPVLTVIAAGKPQTTDFVGIRRLHLKECDRVEAMRETLERLGVATIVEEGRFVVNGTSAAFSGGNFRSFGDHRIAMSVAVAATRAAASLYLDDFSCAAKSYPDFYRVFSMLKLGDRN